MNFKKMYKHDLNCTFNWDSNETQTHAFEKCAPVLNKMTIPPNVKLSQIYGTVEEQHNTIGVFSKLEEVRNLSKSNILPGG